MKIIGGPFAEIPMVKEENGKMCNVQNIKYVGSGRTALYIILMNVRKLDGSNIIWLPAYYCDVAREVAKELGFLVKYYSVTYKSGGYSVNTSNIGAGDIVVFLNYYGFSEKRIQDKMINLKKKGCILIEDITHSLLSDNISDFSNYYFGSLRKWSGFITGGLVSGEGLSMADDYTVNDDLVIYVGSFLEKYKDYMNTGIGNREYFSNCFYKAEVLMNSKYKNCGVYERDLIAIKYWDVYRVISKRIQNAYYLLEHIKNKDIFMFDKISPGDVPFFFLFI